jgi:hypothetical protein
MNDGKSGSSGALGRALVLALLVLPVAAQGQVAGAADTTRASGGKLLLTGGVSQVEGSAGGGLTPWALIGGYGERGQWGANAYYTRLGLDDYALDSYGVLAGFDNRIEFSLARHSFDTRDIGAALGLGRGFKLEQDIAGAKLRLFGDAVLEQDSWLPQVALGVQHKRNRQGAVVRSVGAVDSSGTDIYLSATKLYLAQSLLVNTTVRFTKANQFGLLGFGGDRRDSYRPQVEGSVAWLANRHLAIGGEFRTKPDNLGVAGEDSAWDVFVAWAPNKHLSLTAAWVDLGNIIVGEQRGPYLSLQVGF